jgi:hypothetical protein
MRAIVLLSFLVACGSVRDDEPMESVDAAPPELDAPPTPPAFPVRLSAAQIEFGGVAVGQRSVGTSLIVTNTSDAPIAFVTTVEGNLDDFFFTDGCGSTPIGAQSSCRVVISFAPSVDGTRLATLTVSIDGVDGSATVSLVGRGLIGSFAITPPLHDFAGQDFGVASATQTFDVANTGDIATGALALSLPPGTPYRIVDDACSGTAIATGGHCTFGVVFTPAALGESSTSIEIQGGVAGETAVSLGGRGQALVSVAFGGLGGGVVTSTPAGIDCGTTCSARFDSAPVTLTAAPTAGNVFMRWTGACTGATCTLPLASASSTATAVFEPLRTLTVMPGAGNVHVEPVAEDCLSFEGCSYVLPRTTSVTATAHAVDDLVFIRWRGVLGCGFEASCTFTITTNATLSAQFCPPDDACCVSPSSPACQP